MDNKEIISVIIPVNNGEKYLNKLSKNVLNQSYKDIELIFVENYSTDNSLDVLNKIAGKDNRVIVTQSYEKGTSFARKKGIELATGKYTLFMDQDDYYINEYAVQRMYEAIKNSNSQICQFSYYRRYFFAYKQQDNNTSISKEISIEEMKNGEMGSLYEGSKGNYSPTVWNKIYLTKVLKDAINSVNISLFYAEDQYLNTCCFTSNKLKNITLFSEAYYVHNIGTGLSSSNNASEKLFDDYEITKPIIIDILNKIGVSEDVIDRIHIESLYSSLVYLTSSFEKDNIKYIYDKIEEVSNKKYIMDAKEYFKNKNGISDELSFLASDYSPEEYYNRFKDRTIKTKAIKKIIRKIKK